MRITDVCTRLEDAVCVAAHVRQHPAHALPHAPRQPDLAHLPAVPAVARTAGARSATASTARLFDFGKGELVPFRELLDELLVLLREDAEALGCVAEMEHARTIVARGTSADRQVACFEKLIATGTSRDEALKGLVDHLIAETVAPDPISHFQHRPELVEGRIVGHRLGPAWFDKLTTRGGVAVGCR